MNLQEFAALKAGDEIENLATHSRGRVTEVKPNGVMLAWGGNTVATFFYSVNGTAWFQWSRVEMTGG